MKDVLEYRHEVPPGESYRRGIVSPLRPSVRCPTNTAQAVLASWRPAASLSPRGARPAGANIPMLRRFLRHHLNALHVMAILVRWGIPRTWALIVARRWERVSRWWLYPAGR